MYRQIWADPKHTPFQRILFRSEGHNKNFGVNCTPFAIRVLQQLASDVQLSHPRASNDNLILFILGLYCFVSNRKHLLSILLSSEFIVLILFFILFIYLNILNYRRCPFGSWLRRGRSAYCSRATKCSRSIELISKATMQKVEQLSPELFYSRPGQNSETGFLSSITESPGATNWSHVQSEYNSTDLASSGACG